MPDQSKNDPVVIVGMARTPMGAFQGAFSTVSAPELGAVAIKAALEESGVAADKVEQTVMGCVLPAGQGQAPARQAAIYAGWASIAKRRPSTRCAAQACRPQLWPMTPLKRALLMWLWRAVWRI